MSQSKARLRIITIWLVGLLVNLALVMIADFHFFGVAEGDDRAPINALYWDLLEWYTLPLAAMFSAVVAAKTRRTAKSSAADRASVPARAFTLACAISVVWSVVLVTQIVRITPFVHALLTVQDLTEWIRQWAKYTGFLVSFVVGYFFAVTGDR